MANICRKLATDTALLFCQFFSMATFLSFKPVLVLPSPNLHSNHLIFSPNYCQKVYKFRRCPENTTNQDSGPEIVLLKIAWYGSEFPGIAAAFLRSPMRTEDAGGAVTKLSIDGLGKIDRAAVVAAIKEDFQRSYFVTGNLALDAYEEDCEFADPAGCFRGLSRFKRNCTNFGYIYSKRQYETNEMGGL